MEMLEERSFGDVPRNDFVENALAENDRAVERQLDACLREYFFFAAQRVSWEFHEGVVVLRGQVDTFHEKQMAQELARRVEGVKVVVNRLVVGANATSRLVNEAVLSGR
jgi:osmotically-inducible protein OsmY